MSVHQMRWQMLVKIFSNTYFRRRENAEKVEEKRIMDDHYSQYLSFISGEGELLKMPLNLLDS